VKDHYLRITKYCAYQERTQNEVREKLKSYGVDYNDREELIAQLITENYINEERFAKAYAGGKFRIKGWGKNRIIRNLKEKGISNYCIKSAMKEIDEDDYRKKLESLIEKKLEELSDSENEFVLKHKVSNYLIGRGYEPELVWKFLSLTES
jgi:regulatory protein